MQQVEKLLTIELILHFLCLVKLNERKACPGGQNVILCFSCKYPPDLTRKKTSWNEMIEYSLASYLLKCYEL